MSWKPEVIADSTGNWCGNALRFATKEEAEKNVANLFSQVDAGQLYPSGGIRGSG